VAVQQPGVLGLAAPRLALPGVTTWTTARVRPQPLATPALFSGSPLFFDLRAVDPSGLPGVLELNGPARVIAARLEGFGLAIDPTVPGSAFADGEATVEVRGRAAGVPGLLREASAAVAAHFERPFTPSAEAEGATGEAPASPFEIFGSVLPKALEPGYLVGTYWHPDCQMRACVSAGIAEEACAYRVLVDSRAALESALEGLVAPRGAEAAEAAGEKSGGGGASEQSPGGAGGGVAGLLDRAVEAFRAWLVPAARALPALRSLDLASP